MRGGVLDAMLPSVLCSEDVCESVFGCSMPIYENCVYMYECITVCTHTCTSCTCVHVSVRVCVCARVPCVQCACAPARVACMCVSAILLQTPGIELISVSAV